jgi:hypothetical protein
MILEINTIAQNNDRIKVHVISLVDQWEETFVVYKQNLDHRINVIRAARMKVYIIRFLKSRIKAYEVMGAQHDKRYERMKNLHQHMNTSNKKWREFMEWVIRREETLLSALPKETNASHRKIHSIIDLCKQMCR